MNIYNIVVFNGYDIIDIRSFSNRKDALDFQEYIEANSRFYTEFHETVLDDKSV